MLEKYIALRIFTEYTLPLILFGIITVIFVMRVIFILVGSWWEERQQKKIEEYFGEDK